MGSWYDGPDNKSEVPGDNSNTVGKVALTPHGTSVHPVSNICPTLHRRRRPAASPVRRKKKQAKSANLPIKEYCFGCQGQLDGKVLPFCQILKTDRSLALNWLGHVERMAEDNTVQRIKRWKPMAKRPIGRPKTRWEDGVLEDIKNMNVRNWKKVAQNRDSWKRVVEHARTL